MCNECNGEEKTHELEIGLNLLRNDQRVYKLPGLNRDTRSWLEDGETIELVILDDGTFSIECYTHPIRFGVYFGNRVFLNALYDGININPKFIFDAEKKQWVLLNAGYVCFAENELEHQSNHKLYGIKNAQN